MFLQLDEAAVPMKLVYQLEEDHKRDPTRVKQTQALSLDASRPSMGLSSRFGLYGSPEWWANLRNGTIKQQIISGEITGLFISREDETEVYAVSVVTPHEEVDYMEVHVLDQADAGLFQIGSRVDALYAYNELKFQPPGGSIAYSTSVVEVAVSLDPVERNREYMTAQATARLPVPASSRDSTATFLALDGEVPMKRVFKLSAHHRLYPEELKRKQALSLDQERPDEGLHTYHGLYGTNEWWHYLQAGKIRRQLVSGVITSMYLGQVDGNETPVQLIDVTTASNFYIGLPLYANDEADRALFRMGCQVDFILIHLKQKGPRDPDGASDYAKEILEMAVSLEPIASQ
ncbi:hypothetical protein [Massilia genomosp. 1]|uniref:Uncharacterized protein n=1 Tax=Massilia genomosp. 1 TaxID=2609280 RepID=A0ABX0MX45_9BURK|nr:hypothetical protein [Massilia genomosp. 1]NHZ67061.1 hypothetical protein [Massilia genomosp. 1]